MNNFKDLIPLDNLISEVNDFYDNLYQKKDYKSLYKYRDLSNKLFELRARRCEEKDKIEKLFIKDKSSHHSLKIYDEDSEEELARYIGLLKYFKDDSIEEFKYNPIWPNVLDAYYTGWVDGIEWGIQNPIAIEHMYKNNDYVHSNYWDMYATFADYQELKDSYYAGSNLFKDFEENNPYTKYYKVNSIQKYDIIVKFYEPYTDNNYGSWTKIEATYQEHIIAVDFFNPNASVPNIRSIYESYIINIALARLNDIFIYEENHEI